MRATTASDFFLDGRAAGSAATQTEEGRGCGRHVQHAQHTEGGGGGAGADEAVPGELGRPVARHL